MVGNNLCCLPSDSILVIVGTDLQAPFYCNEAAFRQMIGTDLCLLSPRHDINEISFLSPLWPTKGRSTARVKLVTAIPV